MMTTRNLHLGWNGFGYMNRKRKCLGLVLSIVPITMGQRFMTTATWGLCLFHLISAYHCTHTFYALSPDLVVCRLLRHKTRAKPSAWLRRHSEDIRRQAFVLLTAVHQLFSSCSSMTHRAVVSSNANVRQLQRSQRRCRRTC